MGKHEEERRRRCELMLNMVQCRFCEQDAERSMDIAFQDGVQRSQVCSWHASFYQWMYATLGASVEKRMQIRDMPEKGKTR